MYCLGVHPFAYSHRNDRRPITAAARPVSGMDADTAAPVEVGCAVAPAPPALVPVAPVPPAPVPEAVPDGLAAVEPLEPVAAVCGLVADPPVFEADGAVAPPVFKADVAAVGS